MNNFFLNIDHTLSLLPDQELIIWPTEKKGEFKAYTGNDIKSAVTAIRQELTKSQIKTGSSVLVAIPIGYTLICTILAIMAIGAIPVLTPAKTSTTGLLKLMLAGNVRSIVLAQKLPLPYRWLANLLGIKAATLTPVLKYTESVSAVPVSVPNEQAALVSHSSGSTGKSKAILRSHRVLQAQHQVLKGIFPPWAGQRDLPLFPNILLHNLSVGTISILPDLNWSDFPGMDADRIVQQIRQHQVETLTGNVFYFRKVCQFLQEHNITLEMVKAVGIGGSPVPETLGRQIKASFPNAASYVIYGSSEAEPISVRKLTQSVEDPMNGYAVGPIHHSLELQILPLGEIRLSEHKTCTTGEIAVRGDHVAVQGLDNWLQTGDFGYVDERGNLYLTGRKGNERLHSGFQHYQVEHVLMHLDGIEMAAARATEKGFDIYIQGSGEEAVIRTHLHQYFPSGIIRKICFKEKLEVDARHHSKILYSKLR